MNHSYSQFWFIFFRVILSSIHHTVLISHPTILLFSFRKHFAHLLKLGFDLRSLVESSSHSIITLFLFSNNSSNIEVDTNYKKISVHVSTRAMTSFMHCHERSKLNESVWNLKTAIIFMGLNKVNK